MEIIRRKNLLPFNTFGINAEVENFVVVRTHAEAEAACKLDYSEKKVLGGGSNIIFAQNPLSGLLIKNEITGKKLRHFKNRVQVTVGGGENWHQFVLWAVEQGYGGVENLSLIPGTVGASPIQNIGAYGVELKDVFVRCTALNLHTGQKHTFSKAECAFGYRDSVFKKEENKGKWLITSVTFSLTKVQHALHLDYGAITDTLAEMGVQQPDIQSVSAAVIAIRSSKLPDPARIGNCGSFFKNPEIEQSAFDALRLEYPRLPAYPAPEGRVKVPAGWLIEQTGWKGKRLGNVGSYEKQALVLVNHGGATGDEVRAIAEKITVDVFEKFKVHIEAEVNIW